MTALTITEELVALECKAMDGWQIGDPDPALAVLDPAATMFDPSAREMLDGRAAIAQLYEKYRGKPFWDSYEILDPRVQTMRGGAAVLTYSFIMRNRDGSSRWNATAVYKQTQGGWQLLHAHWSKATQ